MQLRKYLAVEIENPYLHTTVVTIFCVIGISAAKLLLGKGFDLIEALVGAIIFWIIFHSVQAYMRKRIKKKK